MARHLHFFAPPPRPRPAISAAQSIPKLSIVSASWKGSKCTASAIQDITHMSDLKPQHSLKLKQSGIKCLTLLQPSDMLNLKHVIVEEQ